MELFNFYSLDECLEQKLVKKILNQLEEDGKIESWSMERDVNELKAEIMTDIINFEKEIEEVTKLRNEAYEKLKDKNYDLVRPLND